MHNQSGRARHVFHLETSGADRVDAWREATGEPAFIWGRRSGYVDGCWFFSVKRAFKDWLHATRDADLTIYHDGMGADALGPLDSCPQKVLYLHNWFPRWKSNFEWMIRSTGKVLTASAHLSEFLRGEFAWIPARYIYNMDPPRLKDSLTGQGGSGARKRTGIWLQGQNWRRCGNRLRAIVDNWTEDAGELEIVASGQKPPSWVKKDQVFWSAGLPLEFALMRLYVWDSCMLLNDYSLDSPWFLRALETGCFPMIPDGSSPCRTGPWKKESAPRFYEWGDISGAIQLLQEWRDSREQLTAEYRRWAMHLMPDNQDIFEDAWNRTKKEIMASKAPKLRPGKAIKGHFPVVLYERVQRLRSGF